MPRQRFETFAALRHRNFRLFFSGQFVSLIGSWMQSTALSWLVLELTNSAFYLGLVGALQTLPVLFLSFYGGVLADRTDKRWFLFITQCAMMLLALVLGVLVAEGAIRIWLICFLGFMAGGVMAFDIPVRQSFIVEMVGKPDLPNAIALNSTLFNATRVMGPAVAGMLIAWVGMANCFFINAASFVAVLVALALMQLPRHSANHRMPVKEALGELAVFVRSRRELLLILSVMTAMAVLAMPFMVLLPLLARDFMGAGPQGFGVLMSASGLGAFLGGLALARRLRLKPPMPSFLGGLVLFLLALLELAWCRNYNLALGLLFLAGFGMVTHISTGNSLLQLNVPDELRGRVMSLFGLIIMGFSPLGNLLYGAAAHWAGPSLAITAGVLLTGLTAGLILLRYPELFSLDYAELRAPASPAISQVPSDYRQ